MPLLSLPNEIIMQIVEYLQTQREINAVTRTNQRLYTVFNDYLYRKNLRSGSSALFWAASRGQDSTARTILHLGADINTQQESLFILDETICHATALHIAAWRGFIAFVDLLLGAGANLEARDHRGRTPLFAALASKHEEIARTISWYLGSAINTHIVDSEDELNPLHAAARLGLTKSVTYLVNSGADIDARDYEGSTALHHVLLEGLIYRKDFYVDRDSSKDLSNMVLQLLDVGANQELEVTDRKGSITMTRTALYIGMHHPNERIRGLFGGLVVIRLIPLSPSQIGRTWMSSSSPPARYHTISGTQPLMRWQTVAPEPYSELFPVQGTPRAPDLQIPLPGSPWSQQNIEHLITRLAVTNESQISAAALHQSADPFPQLSAEIHNNPINTASSSMWANFGKPTSQHSGTTKTASVDSTSIDNDGRAANSKQKPGGKGRWKPLAL